MDERLKFIARLLGGEKMAGLCREFGVSRKTGYKILTRYNEIGLEGLTDRSRRPYRHANQLPFQIETQIVRLKQDKRARVGLLVLAVLSIPYAIAAGIVMLTAAILLLRTRRPAWSCGLHTKAPSTTARSPISSGLRWTSPDADAVLGRKEAGNGIACTSLIASAGTTLARGRGRRLVPGRRGRSFRC
jgi:hypothetical protein